MRLNLGMGSHRAPSPWVNVDACAQHGPDLLADAAQLPVRDGAADALYAGHLLEHVPLDALGRVLAEWRRVLAPSGTLMVVGPDIDRAVLQSMSEHLLRIIVSQSAPPGGHAWTCSETVLLWLLRQHGWDATPVPVAEVRLPDWPNPAPDAAWQTAILAR